MRTSPDVKAIIRLNHIRKHPAASGYRPAHKVKDDYLTSGEHHYIGTDMLFPGSSCYGTITFITPEAYPNSLSVGQVIDIQEGSRVVGSATIIEIYNKILMKDK